ncbi:MAG: hypothetical protein AB2705_02850 [Candidatus Thiodiazotropha sp.]
MIRTGLKDHPAGTVLRVRIEPGMAEASQALKPVAGSRGQAAISLTSPRERGAV